MSAAEETDEGDKGERPLVVILDANVLIHGKSLSDLPWSELGRSRIEVLFVPPVIRELDKLKNQTGRPNKVARQLSSDIRGLINFPGRDAEIRASGPLVSKRVELRSVIETLNAALKLEHADQALINYALNLKQDGTDVLLITDDTICGTTAQEVGLATFFLPPHWLRDPEADENGKEQMKLKAEIQRLSAAEPKVVLDFRDRAGKQLERFEASVTRWPALATAELNDLMQVASELCPPATSFERPSPRATDRLSGTFAAFERLSQISALTGRSVYEPATEEEIERYKTSEYPAWLEAVRKALERLHLRLEARIPWPTVVAVAMNAGTRPATGTLLGIQARGAFAILNDESDDQDEDADDRDGDGKAPDRLELPLPPTPPRGRVKTFDPFGSYRDIGARALGSPRALGLDMARFAPPKPRDSDAFYWRKGRKRWVKLMELECASWRHGQGDITFVLKARPDETNDTSGAIELSVHAHNVSDPILVRLPIRFGFEVGSTIDEGRALVEMLGRSARVEGRL